MTFWKEHTGIAYNRYHGHHLHQLQTLGMSSSPIPLPQKSPRRAKPTSQSSPTQEIPYALPDPAITTSYQLENRNASHRQHTQAPEVATQTTPSRRIKKQRSVFFYEPTSDRDLDSTRQTITAGSMVMVELRTNVTARTPLPFMVQLD